HNSLKLIDGPAAVRELVLPEAFGDDKSETTWGALPSPPGALSRWLAWISPEPGVVRVLRLSPDGLALDMPRIELPQNCRLFAFLASSKEAPLLVAVMDNAIVGICLDDATFGQHKTLIERDDVLSSIFPSLGMPARVDWNMDVDQDGLDDLLIIADTSIDVYRRTEDLGLSLTDHIDDLDKEMWRTDTWIATDSGFPLPGFSNPSLWLEPALDNRLSSLSLGDWQRSVLWEQTSPGVFGERKDVPYGPDGVSSRLVTRCKLNRDGPEGLATAETLWSQGWPMSRMAWSAPGKSVPPLTVKRAVLPIEPIDIDRDEAAEFLIVDIPAARKAISVLAQGMLRNLEFKWSFVRWSDRNSSWVQASKSFKMQAPLSGHDHASYIIDRLSQACVVGRDLNGDGVGDVAWLGDDNCMEVRLLCINDGVIDVAASFRAAVSERVEVLKPVDTNLDGTYEVLAFASQQYEAGHLLNQGMREYQLVHYRK
ncbi:MAG: hypothetical protein WC655_21300, partial [Candidatus Hydrogenedentales bacterium]